MAVDDSASDPSRVLLIVDDDDDLRQTLSDLFRQEGMEAAEAADGWSALKYLLSHPAPCGILLDLLMPVMDGWELRRRMRDVPGLEGVPVIVVSAVSQEYRAANSLEAHAYVPKPFEFNLLLQEVRRLCGGSAVPEGEAAEP